ncbi:translation initiation factor IF-2-like, partial [Manacus candei]|uniref:translation initiation factor IF-2-like n=1 Tax=Manacus candei TaxID=415023 RepID=UPI002226B1D5
LGDFGGEFNKFRGLNPAPPPPSSFSPAPSSFSPAPSPLAPPLPPQTPPPLCSRLTLSAAPWTSLLVGSLLVAAHPLLRPPLGVALRAAARLAAGLLLSRAGPALFEALEAAIGSCWEATPAPDGGLRLLPHPDPPACRGAGHSWVGFSPAHQAFGLVYAGLGLAEEAAWIGRGLWGGGRGLEGEKGRGQREEGGRWAWPGGGWRGRWAWPRGGEWAGPKARSLRWAGLAGEEWEGPERRPIRWERPRSPRPMGWEGPPARPIRWERPRSPRPMGWEGAWPEWEGPRWEGEEPAGASWSGEEGAWPPPQRPRPFPFRREQGAWPGWEEAPPPPWAQAPPPRPHFGGDKPVFGGARPVLGGGKADFGVEKAEFGGERADSGREKGDFGVRTPDLGAGGVAPGVGGADLGHAQPGAALCILYLLNVGLLVLWHVLLVVTFTYRNTWARNAAGAALGWAAWGVTYRGWGQGAWSIGPGGRG